jgi:predicted alpha/beta-hydrolase family hydrolase
VTVATFDFPYMQARRKVPDRGPVLEEAFGSEWEAFSASVPAGSRLFAGGKSMGGRIATQAAAKGLLTPPPAGLVCFGYPLHPPAKPETRRDGHLFDLSRPMLLLHGTRDPFGSPEEMQDLVGRLASATLHLVPGGDHSLQAARRASGDEAFEAALDRAAEWMRQ